MCYNNNQIKEYINKFSKKSQSKGNNIINDNKKKTGENKISIENKPIGKSRILTMKKNQGNLLQKNSRNFNFNSDKNNKTIINKDEESSQRKIKIKNK